MPITIQIRFQDDVEQWHEFLTIPTEAFETEPTEGCVEYRVKPPDHLPSELGELIEMTGRRCWQFTWFKGGKPAGLSVRRWMEFEAVADGTLVLRTADDAERSP